MIFPAVLIQYGKSMNILITNDDSIFSPGIAALAKVAQQFGDVRIVAPDVEQSSMGQAISSGKPLSYKTAPITFEGIEAYRVNGTPSDCVALGTHLWAKTDLVLSGINMGYNVGNSLWHSGTLAAAKQAVNESLSSSLDEMMRFEAEAQLRCFESDDGREGVRAFIERRDPKFTGR